MPELPEVETTARTLRPHVVGRRVVGIGHVDWPRMLPNTTEAELALALPGQQVVAVQRRGKYLLLLFDDGAALALHRKMSGNVLVRRPDDPAILHTHLVLYLDDGSEVRFVDPRKFGRVYYFRSVAAAHEHLDQRVGAEPLADFDGARLRTLLAGRRGRLKSLLLDQRVVAGLGNIYADEALWEAGLHPLRSAGSLSRVETERLATAIRAVLERAIERRGTTFATYLDADGRGGENQDHLAVYGRGPVRGRAAQPCQRCGTAISRDVVGQRSTFYCERCQKPSPRARRRPARAEARPTT